MSETKSRNSIWTLMTDTGFQFIAFLLLLVSSYLSRLKEQTTIAAKVPGLETKIFGYQGMLEKADKTINGWEKRGERMQRTINSLQRENGDQRKQLGDLNDTLSKLRPAGPVDVLLLLDNTASMDLHHARLKKAMATLFQWTPRLSTDVRMGVLGFRTGVVYRYPLTQVKPEFEDGGSSMRSLLSFLDEMKTEKAVTEHASVFAEAFSMLPDSQRKQIIIISGDVGPREIDEPIDSYSDSEIDVGRDIVSQVKAWAAKGNRAVGSIYVGSNAGDSLDRQWFQRLAQPAGQNFASDSTEYFNVIFRTIEQD